MKKVPTYRNKLLLLLCLPLMLFSQKKDSRDIDYLLKTSFEIQYSSTDSAIALLYKAKSLAIQQKDTAIISRIHRKLGHCNWFLGNVSTGIREYKEVLSLNRFRYKNTDTSIRNIALNDVAEALHGIAILYKSEYNANKALQYYNYSIPFYSALGKASALSAIYGNRGMTYLDQSDYPKAIEGFYAALKIAEKINDSVLMQNNYGNLGNAFHSVGEFEKAKQYLSKALKLAEFRKDSNILFVAHNSIAKILFEEGARFEGTESSFLAAYQHYLKAEQIAKRLHQDAFRAFNFSNIAGLFMLTNKDDSVKHYFNLSNNLAIESNEKQTLAINNYDWGLHLFEKGKIAQAEKLFMQALVYSEEAQLSELSMKIEGSLHEINKKKNNYRDAFLHYERYIHLRDSIFNENNSKKTMQQQLKYEYEKKSAADSVKTSEEKKVVDAQLKQEKTQRLALYGGLILVGLFALFMVNRFRVISKQKKLIEEQKKTVETQKHLVEEKQREILDSIHYAKRIQNALVTSEFYIRRELIRLKTDR